MANAKELREMSVDQLGFTLTETKQKLFKLRFQSSTEKLDAPSMIRKNRREIARILTILRQREIAAAKTAAPVAN